MSLISTAAATAASPTLNLIPHGHKKGGHAVKDEAASSTQAPATTQSLLSSLFESIEQVLGISVTAPQTASTTAPAAAATTAAAGAATTPHASTSFSGIGAHIDTKA